MEPVATDGVSKVVFVMPPSLLIELTAFVEAVSSSVVVSTAAAASDAIKREQIESDQIQKPGSVFPLSEPVSLDKNLENTLRRRAWESCRAAELMLYPYIPKIRSTS